MQRWAHFSRSAWYIETDNNAEFRVLLDRDYDGRRQEASTATNIRRDLLRPVNGKHDISHVHPFLPSKNTSRLSRDDTIESNETMFRPEAIRDYVCFASALSPGSSPRRADMLRRFLDAVFSGKDFEVTADQLADVLGERADVLCRMVRPPLFRESVDYRVTKEATGGRPRRVVRLTVDAFTRLAMLADGEGALDVQRYMAGAERMFREETTKLIEDRRLQEDPGDE